MDGMYDGVVLLEVSSDGSASDAGGGGATHSGDGGEGAVRALL